MGLSARTRIGVKASFHAAHRLRDHLGKCRFIHGHTYNVEVVISGHVNDQGMVADAFDVRHALHLVLDRFDHSLILDEKDVFLVFPADEDKRDMRTTLLDGPPTVENIAKSIAIELMNDIIEDDAIAWRVESVRVSESESTWAEVLCEYT
ncbi:MAG: 6-carboxytetrahydropterin synthase, partial [Alphaproteobacteria bacterium]|nr:6-carboxytetrahydropterin synthase [Alphaproteobacteria bacterium]